MFLLAYKDESSESGFTAGKRWESEFPRTETGFWDFQDSVPDTITIN